MKRIFIIIVSSLLLLSLSAKVEARHTESSSLRSEQKIDKASRNAVNAIIDTMSVRRKVAQLFFLDVYPGGDSRQQAKDDSIILKEQVGGIILMEGNIANTAALCNRLQHQMAVPLAVSVDGEFGVGMRVSEFDKFPRQRVLSRLQDPSLLYEMGSQIAADMRSMKMDINFAPVVDVAVQPTSILATRSFGPDKRLVSDYASALARGMQDGGVVACAKHFPGHGDTSTDSHKALPVLDFSRERIDTLELYPFKRMIADGVGMVMIGHLLVPALDSMPASVSHKIVTDLLRNELGFKGIVTTDALGMKGVLSYFNGSYERATLAAYEAGADILLMPKHVSESIDLIVDYVGSDKTRLKDLDARLRRVLMIKARSGKLLPGADLDVDASAVDPAANNLLVKKLSELAGANVRKPLTLLHCTDLHGCAENLESIVTYKAAHDSIDDAIHTGDAVICYYDDPDIFSSVPGAEKILNTVGNHDCWKSHLVWAQSDKPYDATKADAYEKIFVGTDAAHPHVALWGVTQPAGVDDPSSPDYRACYYFKDYAQSGIRLIVLDCMHYDSAQHSWLCNTLSDALRKNLTVVGVTHYPSCTGLKGVEPSGRGFHADKDTTRIQFESMPEGAFKAVDRYMDAGGNFVCWLSGHTHNFLVGQVVGHERQIQVICEKSGTVDEYMPENQSSSGAAFNMTTIDPEKRLLTVKRIGRNAAGKRTFVYKY